MAKMKLAYKGSFGGIANVGDIVTDASGVAWICTRATSSQPGTDETAWRQSIVRDSAWDELGPPGPPGESIKGDRGVPGRDGQSITGPPGEPGLRYRGEHSNRVEYIPGDVVFDSESGSSYVCVRENRARGVDNEKYFNPLALRGADGQDGQSLQGQRGRRGENAQTIVIENGNPPVAAIFDSNTARGDVLYVADTGHVDLAQANGEPQAIAVGIALASVASGMAGTYQTTGPVSNPAWNLTPGAVYYLSPSVAGGMTDTFPNSPGDYVCILGAALSETEFNLNIHWALVIGS